ncbi:MAG: hypothetical protein AAF614_04740 [Chloroflexota bacterium]
MGAIPWEDWMYHLPAKRDKVNSLHTQAVTLANQTQSDILTLNKHLKTYRGMVASNMTLLVIAKQTIMSDLELADYSVKIDALETMPAGIIPLEVMEFISEFAAGSLTMRIIWNSGKAVYRRFFKRATQQTVQVQLESMSNNLAEPLIDTGMRAASETALQGSGEGTVSSAVGSTANVGRTVTADAAKTILGDLTMASLVGTGIGIFAAIGIDAVFGAINGATERDKLNDLIDELQGCVDKAQGFNDAVAAKTKTAKAGIVAQEKLFIKLVDGLTKLKTANFTYNFDTGFDNMPQFYAAQQQAICEYGVFVSLRNYYCKAKKRNKNDTKKDIIEHYMYSAPKDVTKQNIEKYWKVLADNSAAVKNSKPCPETTSSS